MDMAPAAAVAYSIYISVPESRQALPLSVGLTLIACICAATAIMLVSAACIVHYAVRRRGPFNPLLHLVMPVAGIVLFFFPLYYQFYKAPPTYPVKGANWVALA